MIKTTKIAAIALLAASAGLAQANGLYSDGRTGGAYWNQPIQASQVSLPNAMIAVGPQVAIESDGRTGGAYWGSAVALNADMSKNFVGTASVEERAFSFLEDYNP